MKTFFESAFLILEDFIVYYSLILLYNIHVYSLNFQVAVRTSFKRLRTLLFPYLLRNFYGRYFSFILLQFSPYIAGYSSAIFEFVNTE